MVRIGMNPARSLHSSYQPEDITVGLLTYIPSLTGYFQHRLDILTLTIKSLINNTKTPFDLFVLDNGSSPRVREYLGELNDKGVIDYLLLSARNLGVLGGVKILSNSVLGKFFVYSNDDVYYYSGWLEEHMKIMTTYNRVGLVSGAPVGVQTNNPDNLLEEYFTHFEKQGKVNEVNRNLQWEADWALSTGRDVDEYLQFCQENPHIQLEYEGVKAFVTATHFQFLAPTAIIKQALSDDWKGNLMGGMVELDQAVNDLGYLRLSTTERVTRHIGNSISGDLFERAKKLNVKPERHFIGRKKRPWILKIPGSGRILRCFYNWLFEILHRKE